MHAVQVSEAHVRLEVLRPVEGGADGEPPAVGVGNRAGTRVLVVDRGRFVGDAAAQRPEAVDAGVVADGVEVVSFQFFLDSKSWCWVSIVRDLKLDQSAQRMVP